MSQEPEFSIRRSARARRARLTLTPEGDTVVVLPLRAPLRIAAQLVEQHAAWLDRQRSRLHAERARSLGRPPLGAGRELLINGICHDVTLLPTAARARVGVERQLLSDDDGIRGRLVVRLPPDARPSDQRLAVALEAWLRGEARRVLGQRVAAVAPALAVTPTRLSVRDQRSRWGSATRAGSLSFSWRLVLAPPFVLDAVVVHELAHLRVAGHSAAFWALARAHAPRTDEARRWLRAHQMELRAALG